MSTLQNITDDTKSGDYALRKSPLWMICVGYGFVAAFAWLELVYPNIQKRKWEVPSYSDLVWVTGTAKGGRINTRDGYNFDLASDKRLSLVCHPGVGRFFNDCLIQQGVDYNKLAGKSLQIGYAKLRDVYGFTNVVMGLKDGDRNLLSFAQRQHDLTFWAKIADGDGTNLFALLGGAAVMIFAAWQIISKIVWYRR